MNLDVVNYLSTIPRDTLLYAVILSVIIAPWVYQWRQRVRRWLVRLSWIALGIAIGRLL